MSVAQSTKPAVTRKRAVRADRSANRSASEGHFVLENAFGETVRCFRFEGARLIVVIRHDNNRIEVVSDLSEFDETGIGYDILSETTPTDIKNRPVKLSQAGQIRFVESIDEFAPEFELAPSEELEAKKAFGWSVAAQLGVFLLFMIGGLISGMGDKKPEEVTVTLLPEETIQKMLQEETPPPRQQARATQPKNRKVVVVPSRREIKKTDPIPTRSTALKKVAPSKKAPLAGGFKGTTRRGYGTNEPNMNSIGALGALNKGRGNGGKGGLNLQAVGSEPGSGAGGRGFGGFGNNGAGGRGRGGVGKASGSGLSNAMYGKGLVAAPFGEGSPAPGSGGYGTRGKAGGGEQGAGYGRETIVGSWKGTGMRGDGPAGSGSGSGIDGGSLFGSATGDLSDAVIEGGLSRSQIEEVIQRNMGQITYCYEQGLQKNAKLSGRVFINFEIGSRGSVSTAAVGHTSVRSAQVEKCMVGKLRSWKFPKPQGGVTVAVEYPFTLQRTGRM